MDRCRSAAIDVSQCWSVRRPAISAYDSRHRERVYWRCQRFDRLDALSHGRRHWRVELGCVCHSPTIRSALRRRFPRWPVSRPCRSPVPMRSGTTAIGRRSVPSLSYGSLFLRRRYSRRVRGIGRGAAIPCRDRAGGLAPPLRRRRYRRFAAAFVGGAIEMYGARLAGGCASGHGISGTLQLALSSWVVHDPDVRHGHSVGSLSVSATAGERR